MARIAVWDQPRVPVPVARRVESGRGGDGIVDRIAAAPAAALVGVALRCSLIDYARRFGMTRPTSFRLSDDLLERLDAEAAATGTSVSALVASVLNEGLKTRRFPGIVYRDGPAGRRAGLLGGPDVWEVVRAVRGMAAQGEQKVRRVAAERDLPVERVRLAVDFYAAFPDEIDARIAADEVAARHARELIERRQRLLTS
jgi:hypothetical protein